MVDDKKREAVYEVIFNYFEDYEFKLLDNLIRHAEKEIIGKEKKEEKRKILQTIFKLFLKYLKTTFTSA